MILFVLCHYLTNLASILFHCQKSADLGDLTKVLITHRSTFLNWSQLRQYHNSFFCCCPQNAQAVYLPRHATGGEFVSLFDLAREYRGKYTDFDLALDIIPKRIGPTETLKKPSNNRFACTSRTHARTNKLLLTAPETVTNRDCKLIFDFGCEYREKSTDKSKLQVLVSDTTENSKLDTSMLDTTKRIKTVSCLCS